MLALGASRVVWLREPIPNPFWQNQVIAQTSPAAHQVLYDGMDAIAAANPAVRVVDLAGWAADNGLSRRLPAPGPTACTGRLPRPSASPRTFLGPAIIQEALT